MRIIVIGATGTIGREVVKLLASSHEVIRVGNKSGDFRVDIASAASINKLFREVGSFDAVVSTAGLARFGPLAELTDEDFLLGLNNKLMGQVNLVRLGSGSINDHGSFTLTSGVLSRQPIPGSASISLINAGVEGFVGAAALESKRGVRVNAVSPPWVQETLEAMKLDIPGGMPAAKVALAYRESVEGKRNGEVLDPRVFA